MTNGFRPVTEATQYFGEPEDSLDTLEELDDFDPNFFEGIFNKEHNTPFLPATNPSFVPVSPSIGGYTSEESGYSSLSEDHPHSRSQSIDIDSNHSWSPNSTPIAQSKQQQPSKSMKPTINEGTMINGKTSLYRGVTRTSKTAWGAKYSAKRIVSTCKTQEEAARAYDEYLKEHVPDKYKRYANFCPQCDKYTNSLALSWAQKECLCHGPVAVVDTADMQNQQQPPPSTPSTASTASTSTPTSNSSGSTSSSGNNIHIKQERTAPPTLRAQRTSSTNQLDAILNDADFDDDLNNVDGDYDYINNVCTGNGGGNNPIVGGSTNGISTDMNGMQMTSQQLPSVPMHSFEDNQITHDIHITATTMTTTSGTLMDPHSIPFHEFVPNGMLHSNTTTFNDTESVISEDTPILSDFNHPTNDYLNNITTMNENIKIEPAETSEVDDTLLLENTPMEQDDVYILSQLLHRSSSSFSFQDSKHINLDDIYQDVKAFDENISQSMKPEQFNTTNSSTLVSNTNIAVSSALSANYNSSITGNIKVQLLMETIFLRKYFRNDRKNMQCFPFCREHGNYYQAKMNGLEHSGKGVCRSPVKMKLFVIDSSIDCSKLMILAQCSSLNTRPYHSKDLVHTTITHDSMKELTQTHILGSISDQVLKPLPQAISNCSTTAMITECLVHFLPDVWKFNASLPKKRRQDQLEYTTSNHGMMSMDVEDQSSLNLQYYVDIKVYYSYDGNQTYTCLNTIESNKFDIASTRTLLREKQKINSNNCSMQEEDMLFNAQVPEKKKARIHIAQTLKPTLSMRTSEINADELEQELQQERSSNVSTSSSNTSRGYGIIKVQTMTIDPILVEAPSMTTATNNSRAMPTTHAHNNTNRNSASDMTSTTPVAGVGAAYMDIATPVHMDKTTSTATTAVANQTSTVATGHNKDTVPVFQLNRFHFPFFIYSVLLHPIISLLCFVYHLLVLVFVSLWLPKQAMKCSEIITDMDILVANRMSTGISLHILLNRSQDVRFISRMGYYLILKLVYSIIGCLGNLVWNVIGIVFCWFPMVSKQCFHLANISGLVCLNGMRHSVGKPLQQPDRSHCNNDTTIV